jgi:hypothetical protein
MVRIRSEKGSKGLLFALSQLSPFLIYGSYLSLEHIALVYIRPRYLQARQRQKQAELRRQSNSAQSIPGFGFLQEVSKAVRDGDVSDEDQDQDQDEDIGNSVEDSHG